VAATFTKVVPFDDILGTRHRVCSYDVKLDSSYPDDNSATFGYVVLPQQVEVTKLVQIEFVEFQDRTVPPSGYVFAWDPTHGTIRVLRTGDTTSSTLAAPLALVGNGVNLSAVTVRVRFIVVP
jgi:hypothetical protein